MSPSLRRPSAAGLRRICRIFNFGREQPGTMLTRALPEDHPLKDFGAVGISWRFFEQHPKK